MKTLTIVAAAIAALSTVALAADQGMCCEKPNPAPATGCCCCEKMQKQAAAPTLEQLVATAKDAKGDQLLDVLAAVLNKLIEERKGAPTSSALGVAPQGHQH